MGGLRRKFKLKNNIYTYILSDQKKEKKRERIIIKIVLKKQSIHVNGVNMIKDLLKFNRRN